MVTGILTSLDGLERALLSCQTAGISREGLRWCELEQQQQPNEPNSFLEWVRQGGVFGDTLDTSDRVSLMDGTCVGATIFALFGFSLGATWPMGSVTAGVLGMLLGGLAGWGVDHFVWERRSRQVAARQMSSYGFMVMVLCADQNQVKVAREVLLSAQGVLIGEVELPGAGQEVAQPTAIVWTRWASNLGFK